MQLRSPTHNLLLRSATRALGVALVIVCPALALGQDVKGTDSATVAAEEQAPPRDLRQIGIFSEPSFVAKSLDLAINVFGDGSGNRANGFYPEFSNMITGSGVVSAGPGYRQAILHDRALVDTSAAVSWHLYKMVQGRFELPALANGHLAIGAQAMFQDNTQMSYYGLGNRALHADQSQYRLQSTDVVGYLAERPTRWLTFGAELGWLRRPEVMATSGTFDPHYADARVLYAADPGMSADYQPNFLRTRMSLMASTLDSPSHPTRGGMYRGALTTWTDQSDGTFTFDQYEAEAVQMVPIVGRTVLLGLHAWTIYSDVPAGHQVPFYLMPAVGGNDTLRGYDDFQFHDQNTMVATAELRVAVINHVDFAAFYDAGGVSARYADLRFDRTSWGGGLRVHSGRATFGRIDIAHGSEGWQLVLRATEPFNLSRVTRRLAAIPFVP